MFPLKLNKSLYKAILISCSSAFGQTFLNGDFEINTAGTDQINISNASFNGFMANTVAFGPSGNMDIINSNTYCGFRQSGCWYVAFTGLANDAISMRLSAPLVTGTTYNMTFWDKACTPFSCGPLPMEIGVSTVNNAFGTNVYTAPLSTNGVWVQRIFSFVAPNNGQYITVRMNAGSGCNWVQVDNFSFAPFNVSTPCSPLPIELGTFDAVAEKNIVHIKWTTESEKNNKSFAIEKSKDAAEWKLVKTVSGAGNSHATLKYNDYDLMPYDGISYYRLKQTDYDNSITYSGIRAVRFDDGNTSGITVYPNPSNGVITVASKNEINWSLMKIFDVVGKEINAQFEIENTNAVRLSGLNPGVYFLMYNDGINKLEQKVIVESRE